MRAAKERKVQKKRLAKEFKEVQSSLRSQWKTGGRQGPKPKLTWGEFINDKKNKGK